MQPCSRCIVRIHRAVCIVKSHAELEAQSHGSSGGPHRVPQATKGLTLRLPPKFRPYQLITTSSSTKHCIFEIAADSFSVDGIIVCGLLHLVVGSLSVFDADSQSAKPLPERHRSLPTVARIRSRHLAPPHPSTAWYVGMLLLCDCIGYRRLPF
jgi:hypothetical protein